MELRIDDPIPGILRWALDLKAGPSNSEGYYPLHGYPHYDAASDRPMDQDWALSRASSSDAYDAFVFAANGQLPHNARQTI